MNKDIVKILNCKPKYMSKDEKGLLYINTQKIRVNLK